MAKQFPVSIHVSFVEIKKESLGIQIRQQKNGESWWLNISEHLSIAANSKKQPTSLGQAITPLTYPRSLSHKNEINWH